jgi:hypothetical protein
VIVVLVEVVVLTVHASIQLIAHVPVFSCLDPLNLAKLTASASGIISSDQVKSEVHSVEV